MFNWFDLMRQAQTSEGFDTLARQFHLSGEQSQRAMAAILPAFAMGLQHAAAPNDPNRFFNSMMQGAYQSFWQAAGQSFSTQAQREGKKLLDQLFGSNEVSRRVAHQAADYAGLSVHTMEQVLPLLAGILAGGMHQWMTAQGRAFQAAMPASEAPAGKPSAADPWTELWAGWMNAASPERKLSEKKPAPTPFEEMMASFMQAATPPKPPPPQDPPAAASWEGMVETGREMQKQYLTSLQSIFEDAWKAAEKKR
jgi:hypothetical protein